MPYFILLGSPWQINLQSEENEMKENVQREFFKKILEIQESLILNLRMNTFEKTVL